MKAVIYARVSSKEQEQEGYSIPAQLKLLKEYAAKNNYQIVKEFVDIETAKKAGRENFNTMIQFVKADVNIKAVLCEKTDRLYRNFKDYVTVDELDLEIHLVKESEVLSKNSKSHQKFIHGIKVLMAKNYIDNLVEETRKGMLEKAERGIFPSGASLGYINAEKKVEGNTIRFLELDKTRAPVINKIFRLYATGGAMLFLVETPQGSPAVFI
jgi:site-specific DNA recombinase